MEGEYYATGGEMRKSLMIGLFTVCSIAILKLALQSAVPPAQPGRAQPGMTPYTPTRLEWLALDLEASYHEDIGQKRVYSLHYLQKQPNTVIILAQYKSEASKDPVNH